MAKSKKPKPAASVPVEAHQHVADTRPNIPTRETAAFADDIPQTSASRLVSRRRAAR